LEPKEIEQNGTFKKRIPAKNDAGIHRVNAVIFTIVRLQSKDQT